MNRKKSLFITLLFAVTVLLCFSAVASAAEKTNAEKVTEGYEATRAYFQENKNFEDYWSVWAAYAALGDVIQNPANGYTYTAPELNKRNPQYGAHILSVIAMGENPYHYQGHDLVQELIDAGPSNGLWSVPVFNALALEAAGSGYEDVPIDYSIGEVRKLEMGPDIGGWALTVLSRHLDDEYGEECQAALDYFTENLQECMWGNSMGSPGLSMGCVTTGFTSLMAQGIEGYDVSKDEPWINTTKLANGTYTHNAIGVMYHNWIEGAEDVGYNIQYMLEFSDLYNTMFKGGNVAWISMGVDQEKLNTQIQKANAILKESSLYRDSSIKAIESALAKVSQISEERRNAKIADYGREYYELYDAVRHVQKKLSVSDFNDVKAKDWFYPEVAFVVEQGIMNGVSQNTFAPNASVTRGMFVTILGRYAGIEDSSKSAPAAKAFDDVKTTEYYASHVKWAVEQGITNGVSAKDFAPKDNITREQMAAMMYRYAKAMNITLPPVDGSKFADNGKISSYAVEPVYRMKAAGIIGGMGNNLFVPQGTATRAQAARMIHMLITF
ncbi:MAG: S-layer homology domain-containing protein [Bacillota bacterium]|nr:S-layer homology domain-containing protein [Bacillota bacterium]